MSEPAPRSAAQVPHHLDGAAGAPLHPVAREALLAALDDGWADPAKVYSAGRRSRALLDGARAAVADVIGARPDEISFTGNGVQALHAAVLGTSAGNRRAPVLVHSTVEHSAVLHAVETHVAGGGKATPIGVDRHASVDTEEFSTACGRKNVCAGILQAANHEVGTRQPVDALDVGVPLVVDATHVLGHAELPGRWSVLAADARMWGGPSTGVLAVRAGTRWRSPQPADEGESGRAPGVPDAASIVAAAASLRAAVAEQQVQARRWRDLTDRLRRRIPATVADCEVLGDPHDRLPHLVTVSCLYVDGEALLSELDRRGFAVSSGSSCTSSTLEPSHVLVAMGALTSGNVRISLHHASTDEDVSRFLAVFPDVVADVRAQLGAEGL